MPTTTAQITLSSADLTGDALQLTSLTTLTGHASNSGLTHTTGVNRITFASAQSNYTLVSQADYASSAKAHKVYIKNLSTSNSEYIQLEIGGGNTVLGRLYGGDWAFLPYDGSNDIDIDTSANAMSIEYMVIYEQ
tara:strand:+ start:384 stop:788 length:405 start_codon:yes stop_codon:yes gene_type:complete